MIARTIASVTGSRSAKLVPFPGSERMSIVPPNARRRVITTSIPTPRPDTLVTVSAVEKPGRARTRSIWSWVSVSACGSTTPSRLARSRVFLRSIPRPSSVTVIATLARSRAAVSTTSPSGGLPRRRRPDAGSMPGSTAFRSGCIRGSPSSARTPRSGPPGRAGPPPPGTPRRPARPPLPVTYGGERGHDPVRGQRRVEPQAEPPLEVVRFERRRRRGDRVHRAEALRLLDDEQRPAALQRGLRAQRHLDEAARRGLELHGRGGRWGRRRGATAPALRSRRGHARRRVVQVRHDLGDLQLAFPAHHRQLDGVLQRVARPEQELQQLIRRRARPAAQQVEQTFHAVSEVGDPGVAHRRRHSLHRVHRAEQPAHGREPGGVFLPLEQQLIAGAQVLPAFGQEQLGVLRQVHRQPSTRWTASSTREGWNGFTTKSLAPAWIASTTRTCWPMALHIRIFASGSCLTISRTASIPPMSGMTMSIVTRSGFSSLYRSTACCPVSASPTTSNPACARISV